MQSITLLLENETYKHWGAALCHAKKAMMVDEVIPWSWKQELIQIASGSISILHGCQHVLRDDLFSRNLQILSRSTYHGLFDLFTQSKALPKLGWHKEIICPILCFSRCWNVKTFWFGYITAMQDPTTCFWFSSESHAWKTFSIWLPLNKNCFCLGYLHDLHWSTWTSMCTGM